MRLDLIRNGNVEKHEDRLLTSKEKKRDVSSISKYWS